MAQITLNVTLPEALEAYVNERVAEVGYGSPSDYIRTLIREDQERRTRENLDRLLLEGLDSELDPVTPEYLTKLRREAKERTQRRQEGMTFRVSQRAQARQDILELVPHIAADNPRAAAALYDAYERILATTLVVRREIDQLAGPQRGPSTPVSGPTSPATLVSRACG